MNNENKKIKIKLNILIIILITFITIGIVNKVFQNDTFFNISIGKYILNNGIDMKEHFSWIPNLSYTYSHWAFDILIYIIFSKFQLNGLYIFLIIFSVLTNITLYILLYKQSKNALISATVTIFTVILATGFYALRSQIISFHCFIIEIYCIEKFIETNEKKYAITILIIGIIVANFHAATWPLTLVLFLPYLACSFMNFISGKNIFKILLNRTYKKLNKLPDNSPKREEYEQDIKYYTKFIEEETKKESYKFTIREHYNTKNLIILFILLSFTGLLTPIHDVPYTYIINSMFGKSNFEIAGQKSIHFVAEMQPIVPILNVSFLAFIVVLVAFMILLPTKIKLEHGFLILGLLLMTLSSTRYLALLIFLGSFVLLDLINQMFIKYVTDNLIAVEKLLIHPLFAILITLSFFLFAVSTQLENTTVSYTPEDFYPVGATNYIINNLDYKNIRLYNNYNVGSYLMFYDIPVFIDSRLDVYCSEFNDTDVFRDFVHIMRDTKYYEDIFTKYDFTNILLSNDDVIYKYVKMDSNYKVLYEDDYYTLFEREIANNP